MELLTQAQAIFSDLPGHLAMWTQSMGPWIYVLLFAIVFAETGLIVTPLLPGDSLLFAVGALTVDLANQGQAPLSFVGITLTMIAAAILGDGVNYAVGRWIGPKLFRNPNSKILNPKHLEKTQDFYNRYGGQTIILARFIPIIRTYAPFVAGLGKMSYSKFGVYNIIGAILWVALFVSAGHFFGNIPQVRERFHLVILAILVISIIPPIIEVIRARRQSGKTTAI